MTRLTYQTIQQMFNRYQRRSNNYERIRIFVRWQYDFEHYFNN